MHQAEQQRPPASLYVVATPIGNRDDITLRALQVLKTVDVIAAEDTRHSKRLLAYHHIDTPLIALHQHNEERRIKDLISRLSRGEQIALISDAGTPLISDPGVRLVSAVRKAGYRLQPIPGACAAITALSVAGLPTDRFIFEGFLPTKSAARRRHLHALRYESHTLIFYEAKHRIVDCLTDMRDQLGEQRPASLARELTKSFEVIRQETLSVLLDWIKSDPDQQKGEFVIIVSGAPCPEPQEPDPAAYHTLSILLETLPLKQAVALTARLSGSSHRALYQEALALKLKSKQSD